MDTRLDNLLHWFKSEQRDLPWRKTNDPYAIWISEIMLQQTNVQTVLPYYQRWMERFPTVEDLANANIDEILKYWQGLGYYSRAKYIHESAKIIGSSENLPRYALQWQGLPGIGRYTANAIASIAFSDPKPVVDGNVKRVYSRLKRANLTGSELERAAWVWAEGEIREDKPRDWNQALMELGATICTPKQPNCSDCPISSACESYQFSTQAIFPLKRDKKAFVQVIHTCHFVYQREGTEVKFIIHPFQNGEWWNGLWGLPFTDQRIKPITGENSICLKGIRHTVTNHHLTLIPSICHVLHDGNPLLDSGVNKWIFWSQISQYAMPSAHQKVLKAIGKEVILSQ